MGISARVVPTVIVFIVFFCLGASVGTVAGQGTDTPQRGEPAGASDGSPIAVCGVVDQSGAYTLAGNLSSNETCLDIVADDVVIDGNGFTVAATDAATNATGIRINGSAGGVANVTVRNLTVRGWGTGVYQTHVTDSTITNVAVRNTSSHGIHLADGSDTSENVTIAATVTDSGGNGILVEGTRRFVDGRIVATSNVTVAHSHVQNSANNGIFLAGAIRNARVADSEVTGSGTHGIYVKSNDYAGVVAHTTVENPETDGIRVRTSPDWVVRNNTVTRIDEFDSAIGSVFTDRLLVLDNNVTGVIEFFAGTGPVARQNTVTDSAWDGVRLAATNARAVNNTIRNVDRTGISTAGTSGSNATILDNTVVNSGSRAVSSSGQGGHLIAGNHFNNNAQGVRIFDANTVIRNNYIANHSRNALTVRANGHRILNNTLAHNTGTSITVNDAANTVVRDNTIRDLVRDVTSDATGIKASGAANLTVAANDVTDALTAIDVRTDGGVTLVNNTLSGVGDGIRFDITGRADTPTVATRTNTVTDASGVGFDLSTPRNGSVWNGTFHGDEFTNASTPLRIENGAGAAFESVLVGTTRIDLTGQNLTIDSATPTTAPAGLNATGLGVDIQPLDEASRVTTLGVAYDDTAVAGFVESSLTVWRQNGSWVEAYNTTVDTAVGLATVTDIITTPGTVGLFGSPKASLQIGNVADAFPDGIAPAAYGIVTVPVTESAATRTDNLTVRLTIENESGTAVVTGTNATTTLRNETRGIPFAIGTLGVGTYTARVTVTADNADARVATASFIVDRPATANLSGLDIAGRGSTALVAQGTDHDVTVALTNAGDRTGTFDVTLTVGNATRVQTVQNVTIGAGATRQVTVENVTGGLPVNVDGYAVRVAAAESTATGRLSVSVAPVGEPARDTTGDGLLNDVRGDGNFTILDVQSLFDELDSPEVQTNARAFAFAGVDTDEVTVLDVQALFNDL